MATEQNIPKVSLYDICPVYIQLKLDYKYHPLELISRQGVTMLSLSDAAESIGFRTKGLKITWESFCNEVKFPCIVHWNQNHFIIVYKIKRKRTFSSEGKSNNNISIFVMDPAVGKIKYSLVEFLEGWETIKENEFVGGVALLLEPTPAFFSMNQPIESSFNGRFLLKYFRPYKKLLFQLLFSVLIGSALTMVFPYLAKSLVDQGIEGKDLSIVLIILLAQLTLTIGQSVNNIIKEWINLHITMSIGISLITDFLIKLMRLPISFFDIKLTGDIMQRIGDHSRIQSFMTNTFISMVFAIFTLIVYTYIMASYHLGILVIFLLGSSLDMGWVMLFLRRRKILDYSKFLHSSNNQSTIVQMIAGMQEIKLNGCEKQKRWEWERIQASLFKVSMKSLKLGQTQQIGATLINQTKGIVISYISARSVIEGNMTLGMMLAIQYIIGQLNAPVQQFITFIQSGQDAKISIERLAEIHNIDNEEDATIVADIDINKGSSITVKNLTFAYDISLSNKVLKNLSFEIKPNHTTAVVGLSGSGKTTLIKLLLGFYHPENGSIMIGDKSLYDIRPSNWRSKCGIVMQEGYIFSDTIEGNITFEAGKSDKTRLDLALRTANIYEFIESLPLGLNSRIGMDGLGLSTGQKQRILIARAVYKNPDYLFLDEATNSLDAKNEKQIMMNLTNFFKGRTVVVIAHRLSTVRNADNIIVLDKGMIAEKGDHNYLVKKRGLYYNLVKDQLELGG